MLLENKNAIIDGAGRAVGGAVARALARDRAAVFLAGRTLAPVRAVAEEISSEGGTAEAAQVEALDEQAITRHVADVAATAGRIDILFNAIGMEDVQGTPLLDLAADDFAHPVITAASQDTIPDGPGGSTAHGAATIGRDHLRNGRANPGCQSGRIHGCLRGGRSSVARAGV